MNLNQVTVPTLELERAIAFYQALGLQLIVHAPPDYARFECPLGDATFSLHRVQELPGRAGVIVYFEVEDLDRRVEQLRAADIEFTQLPVDQPWLWREAHLADPDGNRLILFHAGANRKNPPWRIN